MKYLLDTNMCVFVIRQKSQLVLQRLRQHQAGDVGISTVPLANVPLTHEFRGSLSHNLSYQLCFRGSQCVGRYWRWMAANLYSLAWKLQSLRPSHCKRPGIFTAVL